ncbi:MAG: hypothetical protein AB8B55_14830 [Mariniblastus sp.]
MGRDKTKIGTSQYSRRKIWIFRLGAVCLGMLPLLLLEGALHLIGWSGPNGVADPYVGFTEIRPLFELDEAGKSFQIAESRKPLFCDDKFLAEKPPDEFRVFCVGGSTVQGRPFAIETSFASWLELTLRAADESKDWNVVNCGGVSYASYRLAPIMEEIVQYQPDLIILYTGHNEFLEDRTYESVKTAPPWLVRTHERLSSSKTYSFVRSCLSGEQNPFSVTQLPSEVEARLDFRNGLAAYSRDDDWKRDVVRHFEHNLRRMVKSVVQDDVCPIILCNPVCNLLDASPFKSEFSEELSEGQIELVQAALTPSVEFAMAMSAEERVKKFESLLQLDDRHAELHYQLGQSYFQAGEYLKSKKHLVLAKEQDVCPLRIIEPMYEVIERVRAEFDLQFVDVKSFFESKAEQGIPGRDQLIDHVHPTIHGHQLIAQLLFEQMENQGLVNVGDDFDSKRKTSFESRLESLSFMYFELGKDRLDGLKRWAEGRVTREK